MNLATLIEAADTILLDDYEVDSITYHRNDIVRLECGEDMLVQFDCTQEVELINGACVALDADSGESYNLAFTVSQPLNLSDLNLED